MSKGIKNKTLGKILTVLFCIAVFIGPGFLLPAMQTQTAATAVKGAFGIPFVVVGIGMVIIVGVVTMGGIKRIGQVAEFLAPIMCRHLSVSYDHHYGREWRTESHPYLVLFRKCILVKMRCLQES